MEAGSLKKGTSCFHKLHWALCGGGVLWWYIDRSLLGTAEKTQTPTLPPPACPAFYNPLYSGQQAEIDTGEKAHRGT